MVENKKARGPGPIILAGGAEFDTRMAPADRVWLGLLGVAEGVKPRLGVLPTAAEQRPELAASNGVSHFLSLKSAAEATMITGPQSASDEETIAAIDQLDAAYIAGGNPIHLADVLSGSPGVAEAGKSLAAGNGVGRLQRRGHGSLRGDLLAKSLGRSPWPAEGAVTLPHFNKRDEAAAERARDDVTSDGLVGLGIDESTALIWHEGIWRVAGPGRVVVLNREGAAAYFDEQVISGLPDPA